jgi:hypothetical protein
MSRVSNIFFIAFFSIIIGQMQGQGFQSEKLVKLWSTDQVLNVPESVCFDEARNILYVSNINGNPTDKDGNGFISKVTLDGKVLNKEWIKGLNAPKGMGIIDEFLYVTDIDCVVKIDITKGTIIGSYPGVDSKFMNDIAVDGNRNVYASDMMDTKIYKLEKGLLEVWLDDPQLTSPNGLYAEGGYLYVGCKKILKININTKEMEVISEETGSIDGLEGTSDGGFIYSDWTGNVHFISQDKKIEKLLDTSAQKVNAADIEFIPAKKMLLIPTFFDNRVVCYEVKL